MIVLRYRQNETTLVALQIVAVPVALLGLRGCLIKPHALSKEEVVAWAVKDFQAMSSI